MAKGKRTSKKSTKKARSGPGRPRKRTPEQVKKAIERYFARQDKEERPYTVSGLALELETTRKMLCEWERNDDEIGNAIKRAKTRIENYYEVRLHGPNATGAIFALKNFGWSDRHEFTGSGGGPVIGYDLEKLSKLSTEQLQILAQILSKLKSERKVVHG